MTLSRKYRPQNLDQLLGQDLLVSALNNSFINNAIPSSIILHGIRGTGKTTTARIIAKYLNCNNLQNLSGQLIACESCQSCISIKSGNHLDVIEIDAASHTGVDDARQIIDSVPYKALQGKFKVFIIDEVHMLSKSAFNALLKTLEEPPSHVKFIFATTEIKKIPETVLSRCLIFNLKKIKADEIVLNLKNICLQENINVEENALKQIAFVSGGSMRDALSLLDQVILVCLKKADYLITLDDVKNVIGKANFENLLEIFEFIFTKNTQNLLDLIKQILNDNTDPESVLQDLLEILSVMIKIKNGQMLESETFFNSDKQKIERILQDVQHLQLLNFWQVMIKGYEEIKNSPLPNQSLEILLLKLIFLSDLPSISELIIKKKI
jgi:DNA polymerase-3 subunit gamma/tau